MIAGIVRWGLALLLAVSGFAVFAAEEPAAVAVTEELRQSYRVTPGDEIAVSVFGEADLSVPSVRIGEDGRIRVPFIGDVEVVGQNVVEIERLIAERLADGYLVDPKVSVMVTRYRQVFIDGEVRNPGSFDFQPGLTIRKLVTLAGGLTERASTRRINVMPASDSAATPARKAGLDDLLRPGDQVTIAQSFF
ncbi:MAG: polysaccharide export protein [Xanthomonadales bacterium]|jgi:polysaccharide export outer membrane protein|nr:polysaccharide export protein [Xanthomonadales bacterium]